MTPYLDQRDRQGTFAAVDGQQFDLIVIGAGITGAGVARDAALRGLSVALIEAADIASGTSSRSSKMIHGGLRYLAQGDVNLVREAASERQVLRRIAPHLARMSTFYIPGSVGGTTKMRAGLATFERLGKVPKAERHEVLDEAELLEREPTIKPGRFASAVAYPEFLTNDARLTLANVRSAAAAGAAVLTHAPVQQVLVEQGRAVGVVCEGSLPGETVGAVLRGQVVVNAAGPWVDAIRALEDEAAPGRLTITKGIHVVLPHDRLPVRDTVTTVGRDKRPVFAVRVGPITYLGTTDTFYPADDLWPTIERSDVDYLFDAIADTFAGPRLEPGDVVSMWAGIRPLIAQQGKKPSEISRRDEVWTGPAGVLSIAGGKLTAYRTMAERVVDSVVEQLGVSASACRTADDPLVGGGGDLSAVGRAVNDGRLIELWGDEAAAIVADGGDVAAEVRHAVLREGALRLEDYWVRRAARAWFTLDPIGPALDQAAAEMAALLDWNRDRTAAEIEHCRSIHTSALACLA